MSEDDIEKYRYKYKTTITVVAILTGLLAVLLLSALFTGTMGAIDQSVIDALTGIAKVIGVAISVKEATSNE